jgi:hypothetical protein
MRSRRPTLPRLFRARQEQGVAIILSLGILSLVLIMAMSYAYNSRTNAELAELGNDRVVARLAAEATVSRAVSLAQADLGDQIMSRNRFYRPASGAYEHRPYLPSANGIAGMDSRAGAREGLAVAFNGRDFTVASGLDDTTGWIYHTVREDKSTTGDFSKDSTTVVSRAAYVIFDESGQASPGMWIDLTGTAAEGTEAAATGDAVDELDLNDVLAPGNTPPAAIDLVDAFQKSALTGGELNTDQWYSYAHIFNTIPEVSGSQAGADSVAKLILPHTIRDVSGKVWIDVDGNGLIDRGGNDTEIWPQLDLADIGTTVTASTLYDSFVGYHPTYNQNRSDTNFYSPWLRSLVIPGATNASEAQAMGRQIAAQMATNIVDYTDANDLPTQVWVDSSTSHKYALKTGVPGGSYEYFVTGTEDNYAVGEVLVSLKMDRPMGTNNLTVTPQVKVELFNPFDGAAAAFGGTVTVRVSYSITGGAATITNIQNIALTPAETVAAEYGMLSHNNTLAIAGTPSTAAIFSSNGETPVLNYFRIHYVGVVDSSANLIDYMPDYDVATASDWLVDYTAGSATALPNFDSVSAAVTEYCWINLEAKDPRLNGFEMAHKRFSQMMNVATDAGASVTGGAIGSAAAGDIWEVAFDADTLSTRQYADAIVANTALERREDLGRISSAWYPGRSVRLWSAAAADETDHDGYLIDLFTDNSSAITGKVNVNSMHTQVLQALFRDAAGSAANAKTAAGRLLGKTAAAPLRGIGGLAGVGDMISDDADDDSTAEGADLPSVTRLATVNTEYFTIVAVAQALRSTGTVSVQTTSDTVTWATSPSRYAIIESEQKVMATVARDVMTNQFKILRFEHLDE